MFGKPWPDSSAFLPMMLLSAAVLENLIRHLIRDGNCLNGLQTTAIARDQPGILTRPVASSARHGDGPVRKGVWHHARPVKFCHMRSIAPRGRAEVMTGCLEIFKTDRSVGARSPINVPLIDCNMCTCTVKKPIHINLGTS